MPNWTLRPPSQFPAVFAAAMREEVDSLGLFYAEKRALAVAREFRLYRSCLRAFPGSLESLIEEEAQVRTRIEADSQVFGLLVLPTWRVRVTVKRGEVAGIRGLGKLIGGLE